MLSMGYLAVFTVMDGKRARWPGSTGKLNNQRMIEDHMISHYKKLYSAKPVVDCSAPKSMRCNVKYIAQKRSEKIKKDASERTQSARSLSQRSLRLDNITSCSSRNARPTVRGAESAYFNSGGSVMSSPRFNTSFHCKQIVYPSQMGTRSQNCQPSSDISYRNPKSQMPHFTLSCATSSSQENYKSFHDPAQKTYSGDIIHKNAHLFTHEKAFTPRTLKTDSKSTLSTYRYYMPASRKGAEEKTQTKYNHPDNHHRSSKQRSATAQDTPEQCSVNLEWSDDEPYVFEHFGSENKFTAGDFFLSSSRVSPDGMLSPIMRKVTEEEEELMYLEFMTDVTNEIILRGIYTDRVLQRVFEHHIDMNKHRLAENKMRHLLEALQNDLQKPPFTSVTVLENKESSSLDRHKDSILQQELGNFTTAHNSFLSFAPVRDKDTGKTDDVIPTLDTTPVKSISEHSDSVRQENEKDIMDLEHDNKQGHARYSDLENHQLNKGDSHQICGYNDVINKLSRNMAKSLNVSDIHSSDKVTEQESFVKLSDDEF